MRNTIRMALFAVVICFQSYAVFAQATPPSGDTFDQKSNPTKTNGASTMLAVQTESTSYIKFNLATLPANASVSKATLRLFVDAYVASGSFDVYQVNSSWNENTLDYSNAPTLGLSATGNHPVAVTAASKDNFLLIDITQLVQSWANGTVPNYGVALGLTTSTGSFSFDSKESTLTSHQPELEIVQAAGTGTIISVTAGSGLVGGGTAGNVTLSVDSTVARTNEPNNFSGNQTVSGSVSAASFSGDGSGLTNVSTAATATNALNLGGLPPPSFATVGSNVFNGNQSVNGNVILNGSVNDALTLQGDVTDTCCGAWISSNIIAGFHRNFIQSGITGATIAGGGGTAYFGTFPNTVSNDFGTVGGGVGNSVSGIGATVAGGQSNTASGKFSTVSGGGYGPPGNTASGDFSAVTGGEFNTASGFASTVSGFANNAQGDYSTVEGAGNLAIGNASFVAGTNAKSSNAGSFVWGDDSTPSGVLISDTSANQFVARATGGFTFVAGVDGSGNADPTKTVSVAPNSGIITFAAGQTFPGTTNGTITGISAGTGLTGGGTSGSVALNVNESIVAFQSDLTSGINAAESFATTAANTAATAAATTAQNNAEAYATSTFLALAGGALTGSLAGTAANFSGDLQSSTAEFSSTVSATGLLTAGGGAALPATGTSQTAGSPSNPLDLIASASNGTTVSNQTFRWQAANADGASPSANLNLLFGAGSNPPSPTGLSVAANGVITFASGQAFPSAGTITGVAAGSGLTGGGTSGNVALAVDSTVARTTAPNIFSTSQTVNGTMTATSFAGSGAGLTNLPGGSLTGSISDSNLPANVPQLGTSNILNTTGTSLQVINNGNGIGITGSGATGVYGKSPDGGGYGVNGYGDTGVIGTSSGSCFPSCSSSTGVYGSGGRYGVWGNGTNCGVEGVSGSPGFSTAGAGICGMGNTYGVLGYNSGGGYAVFSQGNFVVSGGTKSAVVPLPDDRAVLLYAVESPENWFEDFGSSQLKDGVATIEIDLTFSQTVSLDAGYHVFLTPNGECEGLYVAQKSATSFEVRELHAGKSSVAFDYRIVAKRKGLERLRMEEVSTDHDTAEAMRLQIASRPSHPPKLVPPKAPEKVESRRCVSGCQE